MKLYDDGAFTALSWVKPALDATLAQASEALERHVEDPGQTESLRECAHSLHQVQGTLRMVELYGAAMVVENMERIAEALLADTVRQRDEAYSVLMRGMVQLPDYLERLQSGHKDIPIVLLPLLNDLRAVLGENLLSESALFSPDMGAPLPGSAAGAAAPLPAADLRAQTLRLRLAFQAALLKWFRDESASEHLRRLCEVLDRLRTLCHDVEPRRAWWAAAGMAECIAEGGLGSSAAVKLLLGRVDREIHRLAELGESAFAAKPPRELVKNLLYYVAQADATKVTSKRVADIRNAYHLAALLPTSAELQHAQGSMAGRNRALLDTVAGAIKDDLLRVKEALDIFLRGQSADPNELSTQAEMLNRVGDTLGMLGLGVPRRVVGEQREVLEQMGRGQRAVDEGALLDVAGALLYVEASLDDHIERLGEAPSEEEVAGELTLPKAESRRVLEALIREASVNLQQAKQDIIAFVESPWDHARVVRIPELLEQIAGALRMLDLADAGALVTAVVHFVRTELLIHRRVPTTEQMDKLADALTAIEYYLEATREHRRNRDAILDVARDSLQGLGYWPLSVAEARAAETSNLASIPQDSLVQADAASATAGAAVEVPAKAPIVHSPEPPAQPMPVVEVLPGRDLGDLVVGQSRPVEPEAHDVTGMRLAPTESSAPAESGEDAAEQWIEVEEEVEEQAPAAVEYLPVGFTAKAGDEIDDDIREIFLEEVSEEISNLTQQVPHWKADTSNLDQLTPIRRSFHTLKGSGRLVGATALGEFSWKVENMLNRVLDRSIAPGPAVVDIIDRALASVQDLLGALRGNQVDGFRVNAIMDTADRLAAGEDARIPDAPAAGGQVVRRVVRRRVPAPKPAAPVFEQQAPLEVERAFGGPVSPIITPSPLPTIDPVLLDILQTEVASHVRVIDDFLASADPHAAAVTEPLLRAVHTFHGAVVTVQISQLCDVLAPLETYVKHLRAAQEPVSPIGLAVLRDTSALAREVMGRLATNSGPLPDSAELALRAVQLRDAVPEPSVDMPWYTDGSELAIADTPDESAVESTPDAEPAASSELSFAELDEIANQAVADFGAASDSTPVEAEPVALDLGEFAFDHAELERAAEEIKLESAVPEKSEEGAEVVELATEPVATEVPVAVVVDESAAVPEPAAVTPPVVAAEPASEVAAPLVEAGLTGAAAAPLADDPQPDGPLVLGDIDDDLLDVFVAEGTDILDHSDGVVAQFRSRPQDPELIAALQRDLHTLKGGARMAGLAPVGDLSHAMESLVDALGDGRVAIDRTSVETLERCFDRLHVMVKRVAQRNAIAMPANAIERLYALVPGMARPAAPAAAVEAPAAPVVEARPAAPAPATPTPATDAPARPSPRHLTAMDRDEVPHAPQEMIRVRSDLLDALVNNAGEVSIYRSRLEQQVVSFRANIVELDQTVTRLREQLRKLEIETEAQIIARYQREQHDADTTFDPLELDRFSQLQQLSRALSESVSDLVSIQNLLDEQTRQSETLLLQQSRVSSELQEGLMRTRMVPFESMVPNLRRTLRQAAQELGKRAQLTVEGAHGEMDRNLLERMKAPFEHMLRNALAHGIETPVDRESNGKPAEGTVNIAVTREATEVVLRISDDGRGMDREAIRRKAVERGLLGPDVQLSDRDLYGFILETGFSTAEHVTQLAGRGVGMDVVNNEIKQLGGSLAIDSTRGKGSQFTIRLPFTLAVTQAILIKLGEHQYAIPMSSVQGVARIAQDDLERRLAAGDARHMYAGEEFAIYELSHLLGLPRIHVASEETQVPLLMTRTGDQRAAIRIDGVVGSREIVVKSVGPQLSSIPGIFGATIMGDGSVVMILDLAPLVRRLAALRARIEEGAVDELPEFMVPAAPQAEEVRANPLVMVVDDSITMRKVTTRVLERADYEVATAKDGLDAVEKLQDVTPDLLLLDIEMPRMDGYELATYMRNDARLRKIPIIMITSRTGEKHRQRALELGVERYLGKPYQEDDLLRNVQEVLKRERA
ncbi:Hpt domain-containing protein [Dokdonella sp.]|uniref:Hpt domain-containing protein n=1 Tax=Dokdonella sp. TaxID=2291710 RepID=UPI0025C477CF|nr:Hpt domain-containing protein [Dokdonella sp.]MBX3689875.1 Hpt domain-containing protein [Dokdonella sp.]